MVIIAAKKKISALIVVLLVAILVSVSASSFLTTREVSENNAKFCTIVRTQANSAIPANMLPPQWKPYIEQNRQQFIILKQQLGCT